MSDAKSLFVQCIRAHFPLLFFLWTTSCSGICHFQENGFHQIKPMHIAKQADHSSQWIHFCHFVNGTFDFPRSGVARPQLMSSWDGPWHECSCFHLAISDERWHSTVCRGGQEAVKSLQICLLLSCVSPVSKRRLWLILSTRVSPAGRRADTQHRGHCFHSSGLPSRKLSHRRRPLPTASHRLPPPGDVSLWPAV